MTTYKMPSNTTLPCRQHPLLHFVCGRGPFDMQDTCFIGCCAHQHLLYLISVLRAVCANVHHEHLRQRCPAQLMLSVEDGSQMRARSPQPLWRPTGQLAMLRIQHLQPRTGTDIPLHNGPRQLPAAKARQTFTSDRGSLRLGPIIFAWRVCKERTHGKEVTYCHIPSHHAV